MLFIRISLPAITVLTVLILAACSTSRPGLVSRAPVSAASSPKPVLPSQPAIGSFQRTTFTDVPGWGQDDLRQAWPAFIASCSVLTTRADWSAPCAVAQSVNAGDESGVRS